MSDRTNTVGLLGLGIAATRAVGDGHRWRVLEDELQIVNRVLNTFGPQVRRHPSFSRVLQEEAAKARRYRSRHRYELEELGLEDIARDLDQRGLLIV